MFRNTKITDHHNQQLTVRCHDHKTELIGEIVTLVEVCVFLHPDTQRLPELHPHPQPAQHNVYTQAIGPEAFSSSAVDL